MSATATQQAAAMGLHGPSDSFERDGRRRPRVSAPRLSETGQPLLGDGTDRTVTYTRCTTFVSALSDSHALMLRGQRFIVAGLAAEPSLLDEVTTTDTTSDDGKRVLDSVADRAMGAVGGNDRRELGTAIHAACQAWEEGKDPSPLLPEGMESTLAAYQDAITSARLRVVTVEQAAVQDSLQVAGTMDAVYTTPGGTSVVADIKTGNVEIDPGKIAMQMAVYAHSVWWDRHTRLRSAPTVPIDQQRALLIHLPAGEGTCSLHWVDIARGWEAVELAWRVRQHRRLKAADWFTPYTGGTAQALAAGTTHEASAALHAAIAAAPTVQALEALWAAHQGTWTPEHTEAARARKTTLTQAA